MATTKAPAVYAAIGAVMADLASVGISKNQKNQGQGFQFRGIDQVYNALAGILPKHHLILIPRVVNREVTERHTQRGGVLNYVVLDVEYDLISTEDGSTHTCRVMGESMDSGDKATSKALSMAYKYMAFQLFCIPLDAQDGDKDTYEDVLGAAATGDAIEALNSCETMDELRICWTETLTKEQRKALVKVKNQRQKLLENRPKAA